MASTATLASPISYTSRNLSSGGVISKDYKAFSCARHGGSGGRRSGFRRVVVHAEGGRPSYERVPKQFRAENLKDGCMVSNFTQFWKLLSD